MVKSAYKSPFSRNNNTGVNGIQAPKGDSGNIESAIGKLRGLSQESQVAIASIIDRLALAEGVSGHADHRLPVENIDLWLTKLRSEREMAMGEIDAFRLEFFNIFESGSRVLLQEYPPFSTAGEAQSSKPHIVLVGVGRLGESIVVNLARAWWERHIKDAGQLRITLIDRQAKTKKESLCLRYPQLEQACELVPEQMDVKGPDFERADFLFGKQ